MSHRAINLAFYCFPAVGAIEDFREVARRIERVAPDIHAFVFQTGPTFDSATSWLRLATRPTVTIEMNPVNKWLQPLRGKRLIHGHSRGKGKIWQFLTLEKAGCPVPRWTEIIESTSLDPAEWGPYVVEKPSRGGRGAFVRIMKTAKVKYQPPDRYPAGHPGRRGAMIAQRFIYTGQWPTAYRVLTYFGHPLMSIQFHGAPKGPPLEGPEHFNIGGGRSIVAAAKGARIALSAEPDVLALATRTHQTAFPEIPSLGQDIMREAGTGALYVAEVNPGGNAWMLTNLTGREMAAEFHLDFYEQFGALDIITDASIEVARRLAV